MTDPTNHSSEALFRFLIVSKITARLQRGEPKSDARNNEKLIADLWKDLLGVGTVGVLDNFFDIGGHSLLSMRLIARLDKKTGVRLQHEHVVVNTLRQLAAKCDQMLTGQAPAGVGASGAAEEGTPGRGR